MILIEVVESSLVGLVCVILLVGYVVTADAVVNVIVAANAAANTGIVPH